MSSIFLVPFAIPPSLRSRDWPTIRYGWSRGRSTILYGGGSGLKEICFQPCNDSRNLRVTTYLLLLDLNVLCYTQLPESQWMAVTSLAYATEGRPVRPSLHLWPTYLLCVDELTLRILSSTPHSLTLPA